ncbi:unnamed protein product [Rotaria sp. Silwood1]|nr:unnamed protein product [Rotaria sp. Silwood1]CAF4875257.1 unnamed protein product [Rotaria sp. Silwood1]
MTVTTTSASANTGRIRDAVDRLEKAILKYIQHSQVQIEEYKVLEDFKEIATPNQWNIDLMLKPKMKQWNTKNTNYLTATKRVEYDLPQKFISNANFTFNIDESIISFLQENDESFDIEPDAGYIAFKHYNELREKRFNFEAEQSIYFLEEHKINRKYKQQRERIPYDNLLETIQLNQYQITKCPITTEKKKNYGRLVKRLKHKLRSTSIVVQKTEKCKVFRLGKLQDYYKKSDEYMEKTEACIKSNEVELAHLYYLPKAHKLGTSLRPIISGLKHPTIKYIKIS